MCYVSNVKYLAYLAHQIPFDPIYQICHISYFLQFATVESQICHDTDGCGIRIYYYFYSSFSLISSLVSPSNPNPLLSNPNPHCSSMLTPTLTIESRIEPDNELEAKDMFFSEIKSPNEVGISPSSAFDERFKDSRYAFSVTKVGIFPLSLLAGFGSNGGGWVQLGVMSMWVGDVDVGVMSVWVGDVGVGVMSVWVCCVGQR